MPAMSVGPPLRLGPMSGVRPRGRRGRARSVGGSKTPASGERVEHVARVRAPWACADALAQAGRAGAARRRRGARPPGARRAARALGDGRAPSGTAACTEISISPERRGRGRPHGRPKRARWRGRRSTPRAASRRHAGMRGRLRRPRRNRAAMGAARDGRSRHRAAVDAGGDARRGDRRHAGRHAAWAPRPRGVGSSELLRARGARAPRWCCRSSSRAAGRMRMRRGVRDLGGDGARARLGLHRPEDAGPLEPQLRLGIARRRAGWPARAPSRRDRRRRVAAGTRPASGR